MYPLIDYLFLPELSVTIPDPDKVKITYENLQRENANTKFPFWAKCWPSSLAMLTFLKNNGHLITNKAVLELGAGVGLPSFFAAKMAASVLITDYATEAVELMQFNIDKLQITNAKALKLDWNDFAGEVAADIVLLSDINYNEKDFESLKSVLNTYLKRGATIILATPYRINASSFVSYFSLFILEQEFITVENEGKEVTIGLFVLKYEGK